MLDCVSWDSPVKNIDTSFALTFDKTNKNTVVVSVSQSGSPGQIISVEADPSGDIDINVVLGDRESETAMLLARRLHAEVFKLTGQAGATMKLMLLLSLKEKDDSEVISLIVDQVTKQVK